MQTITPGVPFVFVYPTYDQASGLFVSANIYDVSTGSPVFNSAVPMVDDANGVYSGTLVGGSGKTYLVVMAVYTDGTYATLDTSRAPAAEDYKSLDSPQTFSSFNYGTYDQVSSLFIQAAIYNNTTGSPVFASNVAMSHVYAGVYWGSFTGANNNSYSAVKVVYTDGSYTTPDPLRAPGADTFTLFNSAEVVTITNVISLAVLEPAPRRTRKNNQVFFTQGDTATLQLVAMDGLGEPINLTASTLTTQIGGPLGVIISFPNSQHTILDQTLYPGQFQLALSSMDSASCNLGSFKDIVTEVQQGMSTLYFHGFGILTVLPDVPLS